jgi:hypothetical protein
MNLIIHSVKELIMGREIKVLSSWCIHNFPLYNHPQVGIGGVSVCMNLKHKNLFSESPETSVFEGQENKLNHNIQS